MKSKGFTLVELMIVVVIIGVLASIAIPNFLSYREKAKGAEAKSNLRAIKTAIEMLAIDTGEWPNHMPPHDLGAGVEVEDLSIAAVGLLSTDGAFPNWNGPYLDSVMLTDPWGNNYFFDQDYSISGTDYVVVGSYGPNGVGKNLYDEDDIYLILPAS